MNSSLKLNTPGQSYLQGPRPEGFQAASASSTSINLSNSKNNLSLGKTSSRKPSLNFKPCSPRRPTLYKESGKDVFASEQDFNQNSRKMLPSPPHDSDLNLGDVVDVPGRMHGTVRFVGAVKKKNGIFVGVELSKEFSSKGKNSGDVDGVSYFSTSIPGAGIFLPLNRVTLRIATPSLSESSQVLTPMTPIVSGAKSMISGSNLFTPQTPGFSKFSQSVGPRLKSSPHERNPLRQSLSRPDSPLRKPQNFLQPTILSPTRKNSAKYGHMTPRNFGQSVRGTQDSRDPIKRSIGTPRNSKKTSLEIRSTSAMGNFMQVDNNHETKPIVKLRDSNHTSLDSSSSDRTHVNNEEIIRLRAQLEERDRQLSEQAASLTEMEKALAEVQNLMDSDIGCRVNRNSVDDKEVFQLRAMLREKNDKISTLTAEFDSHRADFRSTIDTLEMASTETERVYEQRLGELLQEIKDLVDRTQDVDNVAKQLKQLEELVQELEEGLEDARRAEVEARGEVEYLRGEVERTRAELRRERGKSADNLKIGYNGDEEVVTKELEQRDDEIRGLKKIIHSLSRDSVQDLVQNLPRSPTKQGLPTNEEPKPIKVRCDSKKDMRENSDLSQAVEAKTSPIEELQQCEDSRRDSLSALSSGTATQVNSTARNSRGTVIGYSDRKFRSTLEHIKGSQSKEMMNPESDAYSSTNESFCELCETTGHDILICAKVFASCSSRPTESSQNINDGLSSYSDDKTVPSFSSKTQYLPSQQMTANQIDIEPIAGKESGLVNMDKWCAVCEHEGHESIDCPFEDTL
ncbi:putative tip elongation protein 1 [Golovinomyces cichoracearum]|uniref:Putative tip elongation protein 1 n=1 Tax=Golovinomyces cichoracearum TaxID=62708 RepID=A0A420I4Q6_9PEZI|nr:putative tip elongation protein 1 [Golovinomyces cichoracearum]